MPIPLGLLAPLIIGAGFGAKAVNDKLGAMRQSERLREDIPAMIANINKNVAPQPQQPALMQPQQAPLPGAEVPQANVPQVETPSAEVPSTQATPEQAGPSPFTPGEISELPILPTRNLAASAPMTVKGFSVTGNGNVNIQYGKDTSALSGQWFQMFQNSRARGQRISPHANPLQLDMDAIADTIRRSGMAPPAQIWQMLQPENREKVAEQTYWSAAYSLMNNPQIRRALVLLAREEGKQLTPAGIDAAVRHYAFRAIANDMGGYMPEDAREIVFKVEKPPISDELMTEVYRKFQVTSPEQVTSSMLTSAEESLKAKRVGEEYDKRVAQGLGEEDAQQRIFAAEMGAGGAGPTERKTTRAKIEAREKPISPKERAQAGIPADIETYLDVVKQNYRILSPQDQKAYDDIRDVVNIVDELEDLGKKIFTSKPDLLSRSEYGLRLKYEKSIGSELGQAVQVYEDKRETMTKILNKLAGENSSRLSDQDAERIKKVVPEIEGLIGDAIQILPESKGVATKKFIDLRKMLNNKLTFIKTPQMVQMQQPAGEENYDLEITADGQLKGK